MALPEPLSENLYTATKEFLERHVKALFIEVKTCDDDSLLQTYYNHWQVYYRGTKYIHNLYGFENFVVLLIKIMYLWSFQVFEYTIY